MRYASAAWCCALSGGEIVVAATVDDCERFHREVCERIDGVGIKLDRVVDAELAQAQSLERTQKHLESASATLEQAAKTIQDHSEWRSWAQGEMSAHRRSVSKENWRLITVVCGVVLVLAGLKAGGLI